MSDESTVPQSLESPDLTTLATNRLFSQLAPGELETFAGALERIVVEAGTTIVREEDDGDFMDFVITGQARIRRNQLELKSVGPGDHYGELALIGVRRRLATIEARTELHLARLRRPRYEELSGSHPALALRFLQLLVGALADQLASITDSLTDLLRHRSLPRRSTVEVRRGGEVLRPRTGTPLCVLLPLEERGAPVVAALLDGKLAPLDFPVVSDGTVAAVPLSSWEGQRVYARTAGLMLLEAARKANPEVFVRLGPNLGGSVLVYTPKLTGDDRLVFASCLEREIRALVLSNVPFREEHWTVNEARMYFTEQGWHDAASCLAAVRGSTVPLVTFGTVYVLSNGPVLSHSGRIRGLKLTPHPAGLLLDLGEEAIRHFPVSRAVPPDHLEREAVCPRYGGRMVYQHREWLQVMGVDSIGSFNRLCVNGQVTELIRVAEGFQEKQISRLADEIASRRRQVRIITIAGPSSSGKTTFIKRLKVQLQIEGIQPVNVSLDDYFVDREKNVRDEEGAHDFEALEALDLPALHDDLSRLLAGESVRTPRYDFKEGRSIAGGGPELKLATNDMLVMEGIHGLNPELVGEKVGVDQVFKIFVQPAMTLPLDRLEMVCPTDLRLLRRIVRDRHSRGCRPGQTIGTWGSVRRGEFRNIYPFQAHADAVFDTSLVYEVSVLKVYAERYLLEVPSDDPAFATAHRLRQLVDRFVAIYPDHVPPTSIVREFIGGSGFEY